MKNKIVLLIAIPLLFILSSCGMSVKEKAIVQSIGVDYDSGDFSITLQVFSLDSASQEKSYDNIVGSGKTMTDAFSDATLNSGKLIFLGNSKLIVLGYDAAREVLGECITFFANSHQNPPNVNIAVAYEKAEDIIKAEKSPDKAYSAEDLSMVLQRSYDAGFATHTTIKTIEGFYNKGSDFAYLLPILTVEENEKGSSVSVYSAALIYDNALNTIITTEQARGVNWLISDVRTVISVYDDKSRALSAMITANTCEISTKTINSNVVFDIQLSLDCNIAESNIKADYLPYIENEIKSTLYKEIETAINKTAYDKGVDVFYLWEHLATHDYEFASSVKNNLSETLESAVFELSIDVKIA